MSDNGWKTAHLSEIEPFPERDPDLEAWLPVRHRLGVSAFGVNAWVGRDVGDLLIDEHDELDPDGAGDHEELYFVADGTARFTVGGQEFDGPRGTFIFVKDPAVVRKAIAAEPGTTVLAIGAAPGVAFTVSPWEQRHIERSAL